MIPYNIAIKHLSLDQFEELLNKFQNYWSIIDVDGLEPEDNIKWVVAQFIYKLGKEEFRILYVFGEMPSEEKLLELAQETIEDNNES